MKAYHWKDIIAERHRLARLAKGKPEPGAPDVNVTLPPKREPPPAPVRAEIATPAAVSRGPHIVLQTVTTPGRYVCMECLHYSLRSCTNPRARHPVSGEYVEAAVARKNRDSCGPSGRYWDARPARQVRARAIDESEPMEYVPPVPVRRLEVFRDEVLATLWERRCEL